MDLIRFCRLALVGWLMACTPANAEVEPQNLYVEQPQAAQLQRLPSSIEKHPSPEAYDALGACCLANGETEQAIACFKKAFRLGPTARSAYHLGAYFEERKAGSGKPYFEIALRLNPLNISVLSAAERAGLVHSDGYRRGREHWKRFEALERQLDALPNSQASPRQGRVSWQAGTLAGPGWNRTLAETEVKIVEAGPRVFAITPKKVYVMNGEDGDLLHSFQSQLSFPGESDVGTEPSAVPIDLWKTPELISAAGQDYFLISEDWSTYVASQVDGSGWSWHSGGDRRRTDRTFLLEPYVFHDGTRSVTCCRASDGVPLWTDEGGNSTRDLLKLTPATAWIYDSYTGRVSCYELVSRQKLWEKWRWEVVP